MSQTPACPDVPDDVKRRARQFAIQSFKDPLSPIDTHIAQAILADRASRALPSTALAARPEEGWKPIETAPKDGSQFLATHEKSGVIAVTWFGKTSHVPLYGWCEGEDANDVDLWRPTHWMPLPPAPSTPPTAGDGHD